MSPHLPSGVSISHLSISTKLILLALLAVVGMLVIGGFGVLQMRSINGNVEELSTNYLPSIDNVHKLTESIYQVRLGTFNHALALTPEDLKLREDTLSGFLDAMSDARSVYEKNISSDEERKAYEKLNLDWLEYKKLMDEFLKLSRNLDNKPEAQHFLNTQTRDAFTRVLEDARQLIRINMDGADKEYERAQSEFKSTLVWFMLMIAIILLMVSLLAFTIIRGVNGGITELAKAFTGLANLDLRVRGKISSQDEIGKTLIQFNTTADTLVGVVRGTQEAADSVAAAAHELTSSMDGISSIIQQQEGALSSIAAALEETSASSQEVNSKTQRSGRTTLEVVRAIEEVVGQVGHLQQKAGQIGSVLEIIRSVSEQINLLSLNAAIEAARAGDAGRGFAVVADEVKKLAGHTSKSTDEIAHVVQELQRSVSETSASLSAVTGSLEEVRGSSESVMAAVGEQTVAVKSISETIEEFRQQMASVTSNVREAQTASLSVSSAAEQLNRQSSQFKV